jgi:hypothetical protein
LAAAAGGGPVVGSRSPGIAANLKEAGADEIFASSIPSPAAGWIPGKSHMKQMEGWIRSPGAGGLKTPCIHQTPETRTIGPPFRTGRNLMIIWKDKYAK